jgi:hypothetical protein
MRRQLRTIFSCVPCSVMAVAVAVSAALAAAALFSDVQGNAYQKQIEKLAVAGIVSGYQDGTFKPDQPVTRLSAVQALARGLDVKGAGTIPNYKDLSEIPEDVRPAIAALLNTGAATAQTAEVKKGDIVYTLSTDKAVYGIDDPVDLTFTISNAGKQDVTFEFPTTQYYDFIVRRGETELARWSLGQTFVQGGPPLILSSGHQISFPTRWLQKDQDSHPVPPGTYQIVAMLMLKDAPVAVSLDFQKGLLTTFPDNTFRPNGQVSRAEFAALLVRAMGRQGEATQKATVPLTIKDATDVPAPLHGYVAVAIDQKVMPPSEDGSFRPNAPTTRAEAAGALAVVMEALGKFNYVKGTLVSIADGSITVSGSAKAVTSYALTPSVAIYRNGKLAAAQDLKPNDQVLLLLTGPRGRAGYIEATGS